MKIFLIFLLIGSAILFQNCGNETSPNENGVSSEEPVASGSSVQKKAIGRLDKIQSVRFYLQGRPVDVDYQTGKVEDATAAADVVMCLRGDVLESLREVLGQAEICEIYRSVPEDQMCAFALVPPYLSVTPSDEGDTVVDFGASSDGCRRETVDICADAHILFERVTEIQWDQDIVECNE